MSTQINGTTTTTNKNILIENNIRLQPSIRENNNILSKFFDLTIVNSSIISQSNNTHNLGSISKQWAHAYIHDLSLSNISVSGNIIIPNNSITGSNIATGTITSSNIDDGTITGTDISAGTIDLSNLTTSAITYLQTTPPDSINSSHIQLGSIAGEDISAGTIDLSNLTTSAITYLQTTPQDSINSSHIQVGSILGSDISAGTIDLSNLTISAITYLQTAPPDSINSSHIQVGSILGEDISAGTITETKLALEVQTKLNAVASGLAVNSVYSYHIANGTILGTDISDGTITDSNILNFTISILKLSDDAITYLQTTPEDTINSSHIQLGSILGEDISRGTIDISNLSSACIASLTGGGGGLTENSVNSSHIVAGTILGTDISTGTIDLSNLVTSAITYLQITPTDTINSSHIQLGSILGSDISAGTIDISNLVTSAITLLQITPPDSINSSHIQLGSILGSDISAGTIDISNLVTNAITYLQTTPPDSINSSHIQVGSILGSDISAGTIDISNLSSACIASLTGGGGSLTENSVNSSHIINGSILTEDICNNAITIEKLDSSLQTQLTGLSDKEGFYGTIGFINNTSNSSGIYNFVLKDNKTSPTTISAGIFTNPPTTIPIVVAENSASRLLRPYYEYNVEYLYNNTTLQEANISFTISGGTYRSANNKYYFTPNNNNINNGLLTLTSTLIKMGFYGTLTIANETTAGSIQKNIQAKLAFNNVDLTNYITISGGAQAPLTISQANRLLVPNSILQLKALFESGVSQVELANDSGFTISGATQNPLQQENTLDLLVDAGQIIDGSLNLTILVTAPPPQPPAKTGFWGTLRVHNINGGNGGRYLDYQWLVNGTPLNSVTRIYTNNQDPITISEINRLTDINVQLTLNASFESNYSITDFSFNGADIVSANQNQTILTAKSTNLTNGTINIYYTINNM